MYNGKLAIFNLLTEKIHEQNKAYNNNMLFVRLLSLL